MALSNADRQKRWRERMKARATGGAVQDHLRDAVADAVAALWACHERPGPGGISWAEVDGCATLADYGADLASEPGGLITAARAFLPHGDGLTADELAALQRLAELADVLAMAGPELDEVLARAADPDRRTASPAADLPEDGPGWPDEARIVWLEDAVDLPTVEVATTGAAAEEPASRGMSALFAGLRAAPVRMSAARRARREAQRG